MATGSWHTCQRGSRGYGTVGHINNRHTTDWIIGCRVVHAWHSAAFARAIHIWRAFVSHQNLAAVRGKCQHVWQCAHSKGVGASGQASAGSVIQLNDTGIRACGVLNGKSGHAIANAHAVDIAVSTGINALQQAAGRCVEYIHAFYTSDPQGVGRCIKSRDFRQIATTCVGKCPFFANLVRGCRLCHAHAAEQQADH